VHVQVCQWQQTIATRVFEVATKLTKVDGVYGNSKTPTELQVMKKLQQILKELSEGYQMKRIIPLGDFNIVLRDEDTNSGYNKKPLT
jgi:exonuclease III